MAKARTPKAAPATAKPLNEQPGVLQPGTVLMAGRFEYIDMPQIRVRRNTRSFMDEETLQELTQSVRVHGVIQPISIRFAPPGSQDDQGYYDYELVFGARRLEAARRAGLPVIPAMVRDLDDHTMLEMQLVENMQRQDINAADEALAVAEALANDFGIEELAHKLGRSRSFIVQRGQIGQHLILPLLELLRSGDLSLGAAFELSRVPEKLQSKAISQLQGYNPPVSASVARHLVQEAYLDLASAPFPKDDAGLVPECGACTACSKRTAVQTLLFEDMAGKDRCLDGTCFAAKVQAHLTREAARIAESSGSEPVLVSRFYSPVAAGALGTQQVQFVKEDTPGARPALIVEGDGMGSQVFVLPKPGSSLAGAEPPGQHDWKLQKRIANRTNQLLAESLIELMSGMTHSPVIFTFLADRISHLLTFGKSVIPQHFVDVLTSPRWAWSLEYEPALEMPPGYQGQWDSKEMIIRRELSQMSNDFILVLLVELTLLDQARPTTSHDGAEHPVLVRHAKEAGLDVDKIRRRAESESAPGSKKARPAVALEEGVEAQ